MDNSQHKEIGKYLAIVVIGITIIAICSVFGEAQAKSPNAPEYATNTPTITITRTQTRTATPTATWYCQNSGWDQNGQMTPVPVRAERIDIEGGVECIYEYQLVRGAVATIFWSKPNLANYTKLIRPTNDPLIDIYMKGQYESGSSSYSWGSGSYYVFKDDIERPWGTVQAPVKEGYNWYQEDPGQKVLMPKIANNHIITSYDNGYVTYHSWFVTDPEFLECDTWAKLGDGDMEQWILSDYWVLSNPHHDWGRRNYLQANMVEKALYGPAYCGNGFHLVGVDPWQNWATYADYYSPIHQDFSWCGGVMQFSAYIHGYPEYRAYATVYLLNLQTGSTYTLLNNVSVPQNLPWTRYTNTTTSLPEGDYRIMLLEGSSCAAPGTSSGPGEMCSLAFDQVQISKAIIPPGCNAPGVATPTPTPTITGTPPTPTRTPTTGIFNWLNCGFETGWGPGWEYKDNAWITEPGGKVGSRYAVIRKHVSDQYIADLGYSVDEFYTTLSIEYQEQLAKDLNLVDSPDSPDVPATPYVWQSFYMPYSHAIYVSFWTMGTAKIEVVNFQTGDRYNVYEGDNYDWVHYVDVMEYLPSSGYYRLELNIGPSDRYFDWAYYDGVFVALGPGSGGWCTADPTPGPTQTARPTSTLTAFATYIPSITPVVGGPTPTWVYLTRTPGPIATQPNNTCRTSCNRPGQFYEVANWIDFAGCDIKHFFTVCPHNIATLEAIPTELLSDKEPFGVIGEIGEANEAVKDELGKKDWGDTGLAGQDEAPNQDMFSASYYDTPVALPEEAEGIDSLRVITGQKRSPYNGGDVTFMTTGGNNSELVAASYSDTCDFNMRPVVGERLAEPMCFIFNILNNLSLMPWLQFFINIASIGMLVIYLFNKVFG